MTFTLFLSLVSAEHSPLSSNSHSSNLLNNSLNGNPDQVPQMVLTAGQVGDKVQGAQLLIPTSQGRFNITLFGSVSLHKLNTSYSPDLQGGFLSAGIRNPKNTEGTFH